MSVSDSKDTLHASNGSLQNGELKNSSSKTSLSISGSTVKTSSKTNLINNNSHEEHKTSSKSSLASSLRDVTNLAVTGAIPNDNLAQAIQEVGENRDPEVSDIGVESQVGDNTETDKAVEAEAEDELGDMNGEMRPSISTDYLRMRRLDQTGSYSMGSLVGDEEGDPGWENQSYGFFAEKTGDELYEQLMDEQFKSVEVQRSGLFTNIEDKLKELKLNFSLTSTLSQTGIEGSPCPVGGSGFAKVVSNPKFPEHPFFRASRFFRVRMRHNNLSFEDDAMLDGRVTCLKFSDDESGGPLDLILHTGKVPQYYSAATFKTFEEAFRNGELSLKNWAFQKPIHYYSRVENVRRTPDSYYDQRYHGQLTYTFIGVDDVERVARLRLIPADGSAETGKPDKQDQEDVWATGRRKGEKRAKNYLRKEYMQRLNKHPLQYRLQIQIRILEDHLQSRNGSEAGEQVEDPEQTEVSRQDSSDGAVESPGVGRPKPDSQLSQEELMDKYRIFNSCLEWDPEQYPWLDLAIITITTPMTEEHLRRTKFQLTNQVPTFSPALPVSAHGFRSLLLAVKEFHGIAENVIKPDEEGYNVPVEKTTKYKISVATGKVMHAGTDADVFIVIAGAQGRTKPISLDQRFRDDFEPGQTDEFEETANRVGEMMVVEMNLGTSLLSRRWFLEDVTVTDTYTMTTVHFPCYQWLTSKHSKVTLQRAQAVTPQYELQIFPYLIRKFEIAQRRVIYQWEDVQGLPGRLKVKSYEELPQEVQFLREKELDLREKFLRNLANTGTGGLLTFMNWNILEDNSKLITRFLKDTEGVKKVMANWKTDEEFGRQILNGTHPTRIERIQTLPAEFEAKKELLETLLDRKKTIQEEMEDGHLYLLTYPELDNLEQETDYKGKYNRYVTSPSCLLYVPKSGHLVPIAITLSQEDDPIVWTPRDDINSWIFAKMWVREADAQVHQVCSRHLYTQLVMEAFAVATYRNLPSSHPVFKLLQPHLRYTIAVNVLGRKHLYPADEGLFQRYLAVGGQHEDLLKESYRHFSLADLNIPLDLQNRGVDDPEKLPHYYYRDDAVALWDLIKKLVRTVLHMSYWNDFTVQSDEELQSWIQDIHEHGLPEWELAGEHNVPNCLWTLDEVIDFVTIVIFNASCQHAALTTGMMDIYGFIPNAPTVMMAPPPKDKGHVRVVDMRKALPSKGKAGDIIAACHTLCMPSRDEVYLGDFPEKVWHDKAILAAIDAFKEGLVRLQDAIEARNATLDMPYTYLLPSKIPKSASS